MIRLIEDISRYSDVVPYEQRKYWYFTTHGVQPGTMPKDLKVLDVRDGQNKKGTWGTYVCLDGVLNTDELRYYDMIEVVPPEVFNEDYIQDYLDENDFRGSISYITEDSEGVHIKINMGDWKHEHLYLKNLMRDIGYVVEDEDIEPSDSDCYTATYLFVKK